MTKEEIQQIDAILQGSKCDVRSRLETFRKTVQLTEEQAPQGSTVTTTQRKALFLWFTMIECEAENHGITWNAIIQHTHQLKITKEGLHGMCKTLQEALWGTNSTTQLKKNGNIEIIIDHFTDLFAKEGLELPTFPSEENKGMELLASQHIDIRGDASYPDAENVTVKF